ncbi:MAG: hypothetical protein Q9M33_12310 [Robiginitomaculum sp.]|nr:hypothetical protein [Robiginitomaculum sp.]
MRNDAHIWHVRRDNIFRIIRAGNALAGIRVFDVAHPVPYQFSDIKLIIQNAGSAFAIAVNRALRPAFAGRPWDFSLIEFKGYLLRRFAFRVIFHDTDYDSDLLFVDFTATTDWLAISTHFMDDIIAIGFTASILALQGKALQSAMGFARKFF